MTIDFETVPGLTCGRTYRDDDTEVRTPVFRQGENASFTGCGGPLVFLYTYRCLQCGRWMHGECLRKHFAVELPERRDVVTFVLVNGSGKLLMEWRDDWPPAPGAWVFPGGKREHGETPIVAVKREAREELGIEIVSMLSLKEVASTPPWINIPFVVTCWSGIANEQTDQGHRLRWVTPVQALMSDWPPAAQIARDTIHALKLVKDFES
jgi:8-oxo-dGTP diphosphatase